MTTNAVATASSPESTGDVGAQATGKLLRDGTGLYPRAIRLSNGTIVASVVDFDARGGVGVIYHSTDNGANFRQVGAIHDQAASGGLCCTSLFELPHQIGTMPAGTLLWAASIGQNAPNRRMTISLWRSPDRGVSWSYLSVCRVAHNTGGLWEPELSVNAAGELVCHYSDETRQPQFSQLLVETYSRDGIHWGTIYNTVASRTPGHRPGMPVVRRLNNGTWYMSYEICGTGNQFDCAAYYRTSRDGGNWGDPALLGTMVRSRTNQYFTHAPTIAAVGGRLVMVGQQLREANGAISGGSGRTVMVNDQGGGGGWNSIGSPVAVPSPPNNYCPNYSSALLPSVDGRSLLEIATDYDRNVCKPYYATGPM
ncbi:glycoside hydrolase [Allokutzneria sp. A3M-2-11 16]|uniref:sialidase family protein n=1 Tax=Allokutzneria sp. A3M-2-11 16 TaxID=2962043 RepID=UPI0020B82980|nr:sialidase family protein [Allokutzneria sp. A3M-2-11 16]MCP3805039.1 glycoside hydrolase [Allokutzneria sp. A3M-2-11 16]